MKNTDDIISILNAVNEINLRTKKKKSNEVISQKPIPRLNDNLIISPDINRIIQEAEEYKNKSFTKKTPNDNILKKTNSAKINNFNQSFEKVRNQIINELYSQLAKKVKKNTLKVIFNLHLKIKNLEDKLENNNKKKTLPLNQEVLILRDEVITSTPSKDFSILKLEEVFSKSKNVLSQEVVKSLSIQDSTISFLTNKINIFKENEEKLRAQLVDLEQDKTILLSKAKKADELKYHKNNINITKEKLKSIYNQIEIQKNIYIDLKKHSVKTELASEFFKESYAKLVVENNEIKKRLIIAKDQIVTYESNKLDLLSSISKLNEILSKTDVAAIISPSSSNFKKNVSKEKEKTTITE